MYMPAIYLSIVITIDKKNHMRNMYEHNEFKTFIGCLLFGETHC